MRARIGANVTSILFSPATRFIEAEPKKAGASWSCRSRMPDENLELAVLDGEVQAGSGVPVP
jgi:hypothetical protein